jgi:hypothetical protein
MIVMRMRGRVKRRGGSQSIAGVLVEKHIPIIYTKTIDFIIVNGVHVNFKLFLPAIELS